MIKNERQYRTTKTQAERFSRALRDLPARSSNDPLMRKLEASALTSQLDELRRQLREYDQLRSGEGGVITTVNP